MAATETTRSFQHDTAPAQPECRVVHLIVPWGDVLAGDLMLARGELVRADDVEDDASQPAYVKVKVDGRWTWRRRDRLTAVQRYTETEN
jgi:hypothetical protein